MDAVAPEIITLIATELQHGAVGDARARELAAEVGRLNAAVLRDAGALGFANEPADFAGILERAAP